MYPYIHIFGRPYGTYGLCVLVGCGLVFGYEALVWRKKKDLYFDRFVLAVFALAGMGLGAFLLQELVQIRTIISILPLLFTSPKEFITKMPGGFVMYGGLFGAFAGCAVYAATFKEDLREKLRDSIPAFPLFHACGRVGCAMAGCCYGYEVETGGIWNETVQHYCLPVQLYEAAGVLLIFFVLLLVYKKKKDCYFSMGTYFILYAILRFTLEFFRDDAIRGHILSLSTSQWISLLILPVGILCLIFGEDRNILNKLFVRSKKVKEKHE